MSNPLQFSFVVLGITSLVGQVVMTRELMVSFYGNEFFIGWILFSWLFWVGMGSLSIRSFQKIPLSPYVWLGFPLALAVLIPLMVCSIRLSRNFFILLPGQIPDLFYF